MKPYYISKIIVYKVLIPKEIKMSRKCSYCRSTEHTACNCTSPKLLNCLAGLCQDYNFILMNITDTHLTQDEAITIINQQFNELLYHRFSYYKNTLNVLVRNLKLCPRMTKYATSCLLISHYIFERSKRNYRNLPILYGFPVMVEEFFMINRIPNGIDSPELAHYKDFILNNDFLKILLNLKFKQFISLEIEHVTMMEIEVLEDCPICMTTIATSSKVTTNCNHNYCNTCFDQLVEHSRIKNESELPKCALCRERITICYKHTIIPTL